MGPASLSDGRSSDAARSRNSILCIKHHSARSRTCNFSSLDLDIFCAIAGWIADFEFLRLNSSYSRPWRSMVRISPSTAVTTHPNPAMLIGRTSPARSEDVPSLCDTAASFRGNQSRHHRRRKMGRKPLGALSSRLWGDRFRQAIRMDPSRSFDHVACNAGIQSLVARAVKERERPVQCLKLGAAVRAWLGLISDQFISQRAASPQLRSS